MFYATKAGLATLCALCETALYKCARARPYMLMHLHVLLFTSCVFGTK